MITGFNGILSVTVFLPALAALLIWLVAKSDRQVRFIAVTAGLCDLVLAAAVTAINLTWRSLLATNQIKSAASAGKNTVTDNIPLNPVIIDQLPIPVAKIKYIANITKVPNMTKTP
jgi:hypothetical protein